MTEQPDLERKKNTEKIGLCAHDLIALYDLTAGISALTDRKEIFESLQKHLTQQYQIPAGAVYLINSGKNLLLLEKHWGWADDGSGVVSRFSADTYPYKDVLQQKKTVLVNDAHEIEHYSNAVFGDFQWVGLSIPLIAKGDVIGILDLFAAQPSGFRSDRTSLFSIIGHQVGAVIQNVNLSEEIRAGRERLKVIAQRNMVVQEAERRHIARELHDVIGQALTALKVNLQAIQYIPEANGFESQLRESIGIIDRTLEQVRNLSLDLRPSLLDDLGVVSAIRWYLDHQAQRVGFKAQFLADPPEMRLYPELETTCFRVVQEAVTNVIRHAQATVVRVELSQDKDLLVLTIRDDGVGFDVRAAKMRGGGDPSLGLLSMEERVQLMGGKIEVHSDTTQQLGTEIRCIFPLEFPPAHPERHEKRKESE